LPLSEWLDDARRWVEAGHRQDAKMLLVALRAVHPRSRPVLELLAQTLEDCDEFREAALVYRDLLRPSLSRT
jgi:sirohydrochlorin ferrochelatase